MSNTGSLSANSSFDRNSSMYGTRTFETYSAKSYELMYGLLRLLSMKSAPNLLPSGFSFISTASLS
jgi:hypothetical protein